MIRFRRLRRPFFYCYFGVLLLSGSACFLYSLISKDAHHELYIVISLISATMALSILWFTITATALLVCSAGLYFFSGVLGYLYSAVLLLLLVAGHANLMTSKNEPVYLALRIALAVVVVFSWGFNNCLVNWAIKLRQELEYERSILDDKSYVFRIETRD